MATGHGGAGQPMVKDPNPQEQNTNDQDDYQHEDIDSFEEVDYEDYVSIKTLTRELDHLRHKVEIAKGYPTEATSHLECELHRLFLEIWPSAPPEPLDDVVQ